MALKLNATFPGYCGREVDRVIRMDHDKGDQHIARLSDQRARDYRGIDTIDGRVWSESLGCWVYTSPPCDLSLLASKYRLKTT